MRGIREDREGILGGEGREKTGYVPRMSLSALIFYNDATDLPFALGFYPLYIEFGTVNSHLT